MKGSRPTFSATKVHARKISRQKAARFALQAGKNYALIASQEAKLHHFEPPQEQRYPSKVKGWAGEGRKEG